MSIKVISTSRTDNKETVDFLETLAQASNQLEILAQIQATVGGLAMSSRANETFETKARLDNFIDQIIFNQQKEG